MKHLKVKSIPQIWDDVDILIPSRIHMSLFNDERISLGNPWWWCLAMAINGFNTSIRIEVCEWDDLNVIWTKVELVEHIRSLFKNHCWIKTINWFNVDVKKHENLHLWFGSSVSEFLWILLAFNVLYWNILTNKEIRKMVGYNYVEYDNNKQLLSKGYETGWWPASMLYGWIVLLTDCLEIVDRFDVADIYKVLCFIPKSSYLGEKKLWRDPFWEQNVFFESKKFHQMIGATANKVFYDLLPVFKAKDMDAIWDIVEDLNFMMGNIGTIRTRYSVSYFYLFEKIRKIWGKLVGLSSTWPIVYVLATEDVLNQVKYDMSNDIDEILGVFDVSQWILIKHNWRKIKTEKYPDTEKF